METPKPVHTLVLDTGAIIRNEPSVSTLLGQSESLVTVPAIISEIKDAATRSRVETTLQPFLTLKSPSPASIKFVTDFARRTGDLAVLSRPDIHIIALTYEIECERNHGDWRLRKLPGQKVLNGAPPPSTPTSAEQTTADADVTSEPQSREGSDVTAASLNVSTDPAASTLEGNHVLQGSRILSDGERKDQGEVHSGKRDEEPAEDLVLSLAEQMKNSTVEDEVEAEQDLVSPPKVDFAQNSTEDSASDSEGWITPSNLKKKQAKDASAAATEKAEPKTMQVAVLTTDFAMQNVILQINLNLLSPSLHRVKQLKTFVLRCHACFQVTKEMSRQFCPRCGKPTLTRVACSTNVNGEFKLHLKKNMQWNHRGDRYSIPKPGHGSSNGRRNQGGGKDGWGNELILAEDQKEYQRNAQQEKRLKQRDLMDEDYLPSILTGDRGRAGGRMKVGAGRNVNAKRR